MKKCVKHEPVPHDVWGIVCKECGRTLPAPEKVEPITPVSKGQMPLFGGGE